MRGGKGGKGEEGRGGKGGREGVKERSMVHISPLLP